MAHITLIKPCGRFTHLWPKPLTTSALCKRKMALCKASVNGIQLNPHVSRVKRVIFKCTFSSLVFLIKRNSRGNR